MTQETDDSFTCSSCKKTILGKPSVSNNAGKFCWQCFKVMRQKSKETIDRKKMENDGKCLWCGGKDQGKPGESVCYQCMKNRDWLLACIRYSERPFKYIAAREAEEKKNRAKRIAQEKASREAEIPQSEEQQTKTKDQDGRLERVEAMLAKLMSALGE